MEIKKVTTALDSDRALESEAEDQFGFAGIAKRLAPSIIEASKGDGMVIGLEGRWGSGKTSLLNFLRAELDTAQQKRIYTITIAPWLNGDTSPLVTSLLEPMVGILEKQEEQMTEGDSKKRIVDKKKIEDFGKLLKNYGPKTARRAASVANFAGYFVPGSQAVGKALTEAASMTEQFIPSGETPSELKCKITNKIKELNVGFVVILDDLDRLEPEQAVEVVRLVRSVADFPRVAYLMCYDREILAQALKTGLKVEDGDLFLQKIVQLTFNIPLPEPFDLRNHFRNASESIYENVMGTKPEGKVLNELRSAVDREGNGLSTPREVKLALNSIRFVFPQVKDDVYFPDLCRLHLIKTTNYKLYQWLESYLSERSVLVTGDATIPKDEKVKMGNQLLALLPASDYDSVNSIWNLKRFIPGVVESDDDEKRVFREVSATEVSETISLKRLGSPLHYRFYFALTGPKTVMPDEEFNCLLELARSNVPLLITRLSEEAKKRRSSGKTWLEHVLDRLDKERISSLDEEQLSGVIKALSGMMDVAIAEDNEHRVFALPLDGIANKVVRDCLSKLKELNSEKQAETIRIIASEGEAINWLVGKFFRSQLFLHGIVGDDAVSPDEWEISQECLDEAISILQLRINKQATRELIPKLPDITSFLYGWLNMSEKQQVVDWVKAYIIQDEGFIHILNSLRGWAMSDIVYYPLSKDTVELFLDWEETICRLDQLEEGKYAKQVKELKQAIKQSKF